MIIQEQTKELYDGQSPFQTADPAYKDSSYELHTYSPEYS